MCPHSRLGHGLASAAFGLALAACAAHADDATFERWWHDGKAELDGYRLHVSRYGQPRVGQAVMVFVTEPFSESRRVKVEDATRDPRDTFDALKLNFVRDFQTGIYDYNTMLSVFVRSGTFAPVKISFASSEWCGNVYEEMRIDPRTIAHRVFSYFDGESKSESLPHPAGGLLEDELFLWVRGLRHDPLAPGEKRTAPILPGAFHRRLAHRPAVWSRAELSRGLHPETIQVPAGRFACATYRVQMAEGRDGRFWIETSYPHRVIRWEWSPPVGAPAGLGSVDGGELTGTERLSYWKLNGNGDESYLKRLGIEPTVR